MAEMSQMFQKMDWKTEKHVPVLEARKISENYYEVSCIVGKEIPHPNKTEHHIKWIQLYFLGDGEKYPYEIGRSTFESHGASVKGPETSGVYSDPYMMLRFKPGKSGTIMAESYCNIHGLWTNDLHLQI